MSLLDIEAEVTSEAADANLPRCVIGQALRLIEKHDPNDLPKALAWIGRIDAGQPEKSQVETATILTRYTQKVTGVTSSKIAPGSVGNHYRKGCVCP